MKGQGRKYLDMASAPGTWEKVLAAYAFICAAVLFMGVQELVAPMGLWGFVGIVSLTVLGPYLIYIWGRKRPVRRFVWDVRIWLLTLIAGLGVVVGFRSGGEGQALNALTLYVILAGFGLAGLWEYLKLQERRGSVLSKAEQTGWRISRKDEADLGLEDTLLREMGRRERLRHGFVVALGFLVFISCVGLLLFLEVDALDGYLVLWVIFILNSTLVHVYYSSLVRRQFIEKKRGAYELQAARRMQMALMPKEDPRVEGFDISGVTVPAEEVGGDLFAYITRSSSPESLGIAVADVSGKAMKAAIATVLVSGILRSQAGQSVEPSEVLARVNKALLRGMDPLMFVAMQMLVLDGRSGKLLYANAGQVHPYLLRKGALSPIAQNALPLGISASAEYETLEVALEEGDLLFLFSDGITEAMDERREIFSHERLEEAILEIDSYQPPRALIGELMAKVSSFCGSAPPSDDRTIVVMKRIKADEG